MVSDRQHDEERLPVRQLCVRLYILIVFVIYLDATRWHLCRTMIDSVGRKVNDGPKHTLDAPEK